MSKTYKQAGVDIDAADASVRTIKSLIRSTFSENVLTDIGLFGGFYRPDFKQYKDPVLVSSVDGVGTKLHVAILANKYDTVGSDLVNHCVNDIAVSGAVPLFFMDYFAAGKLEPNVFEDVIRGFVQACKENNCSLIGGETAEMPGMYKDKDFDLAGTIVGIVDKENIINGSAIQAGDVLIGIPSNGLHTNGYSLARSILFEQYAVDDHIDEFGCTLAEELLRIHRSYLHHIQQLINETNPKGFSHITGGGIVGNTIRILPDETALEIDWNSWEVPVIFKFIQRIGSIEENEMRRVFNMGIGLVVVADKEDAEKIITILSKKEEKAVVMGEVVHN